MNKALIWVLFALLFSTGCTFSRPGAASVPVSFNAPPALPQIIDAVNANSQRVRQLHSDNVRLSVPGQLGSLSATLDYERANSLESPGRFRLSGEALGSRQLDLGSNDREYWMWVKQNQPPTVFWGRHAQFHQSAARSILPMPPSWIVEAMGLVAIDPQAPNEIYQSQFGTEGLLQVRSPIMTPQGTLLRVLEIDWTRALIVQQQVYDTSGHLLAVADTADFYHDPLAGVTLPRSIKVKLPPAGLSFNFEVGEYTINQPVADPMTMWSMPQIPAHQYRDLANPADVQGVNLMGAGPDFYDERFAVSEPIRPESSRSAWLRMPSLNFWR